MFSTRFAAVALATAFALPVAAQAAPTALTKEQAVSPIAAWKGTTAWSQYDPATKEYALVVSQDGGAPVKADVPTQAQPFAVDLGTSTQGTTQIVYARGGDLYRYSPASGGETAIAKTNSAAVESLPSVMRGRIAFVRKGRTSDRLMVTGIRSTVATTTLLTLPHKSGRIIGTELSWDRIGYVVNSAKNGFGSEVFHTRTLRSLADRTIYKATSGGANAARITKPSLTPDLHAFVFARTNNGSGRGNRIIRYDVAKDRLTYAKGSSRYVGTAYVDDTLGVATFSDDSGTGTCFGNVNDTPEKTRCHVDLTGPLAFGPQP